MAYLTVDMSELLTDEHLEKLQNANVWTINDLFSTDLMNIKRASGVKFHVLKELYDKIKQRYTLPCRDANFLVEKSIQECKMVPTGLPELTSALDGGYQTQEIVEISGDSETGKTEMCYLLCGEILSHYEGYNILYVASNYDFDHDKVVKYTQSKAGNRKLSEDHIFKLLSRLEIAKPTRLADLVHLLNTVAHGDKRNQIRCIIIDSLSFIIQEDILEIKTADMDEADELEKFCALRRWAMTHHLEQGSSHNYDIRWEILDSYLHEVMRLLISIALTKNVIIVLTSSDLNLSLRKPWSNAIDHRIHLTTMPDYSRYTILNPRSTVCRATIVKTIHNLSKIGFSIPFAINDDGLFAVRLAPEQPSEE